jgi:hypothetical protein
MMKRQRRRPVQPLMFFGDEVATAGRATRKRNRRVERTKQEKTELSRWDSEGGKPASFSPPSRPQESRSSISVVAQAAT